MLRTQAQATDRHLPENVMIYTLMLIITMRDGEVVVTCACARCASLVLVKYACAMLSHSCTICGFVLGLSLGGGSGYPARSRLQVSRVVVVCPVTWPAGGGAISSPQRLLFCSSSLCFGAVSFLSPPRAVTLFRKRVVWVASEQASSLDHETVDFQPNRVGFADQLRLTARCPSP